MDEAPSDHRFHYNYVIFQSAFSQREHFRNPFSTNDVVLIGKGGALALFIQFPERQEAVEEIIGGAIDKKPDELCEIFIHA